MEEKSKTSKDGIQTLIAACLPWVVFIILNILAALGIAVPIVVQMFLGICIMGIIIYIAYSSISKLIKGTESKLLYALSLTLVGTYYIFVKIVNTAKFFG